MLVCGLSWSAYLLVSGQGRNHSLCAVGVNGGNHWAVSPPGRCSAPWAGVSGWSVEVWGARYSICWVGRLPLTGVDHGVVHTGGLGPVWVGPGVQGRRGSVQRTG